MTGHILLCYRVQVGSSVVTASLTLAVLFYWYKTLFVLLLLHAQLSFAGEYRPEPSSPGGEDAIKHINAQASADDHIDQIANSH